MADYEIDNMLEFYRRLPKGDESAWFHLTDLSLPNSKVSVLDPMFSRDARYRVTIDVPAGLYQASFKLMHYPTEERVSRLRVSCGTPGALGLKCGEVGVDSGQIAVYNPIAFDKIAMAFDECEVDKYYEAFEPIGLTGVVKLVADEKVVIPVVAPGFGDGVYPVFDVSSGGTRVGIEVVFIGPEILVELGLLT